ncbi:hypothetical protein GCM10007049_18470 [Echinicola pacifica]|uniref:O-methyltransferase n=1 Tax=Echinicola pacifica TaxID=346377 RepID=A0A918PZV3_9BACT|nr:class I SAM-dependent methyltransferase [Echinicola pacifica]GGZ26168.1 hypothetical protein GCM10007049_18470 [Echinicola pacifica]
MNDSLITDIPEIYAALQQRSSEIGFTMPSDLYIGSLLKTLISSKPNGKFLELGTGIGLSLSWMVDGMMGDSSIISVDNDPQLIDIAGAYFGMNPRVQLICQDGAEWIRNYEGGPFDLIFADAWPGKYSCLDEALALLKIGGMYVIDDMSAQPNWPEGHQDNVDALVADLEQRENFHLTKMNWSTGILLATKIA